MKGNVKMVGGVNIQLTNFGVYSGKYSVDEATHSVGGGYTTTVKAHKVLVGY
jgi:phage protein D